jgi:hypothetical protein
MPRFTKDDQEDNRYSLTRRQSQRLYLIVKDPITKTWKFPETIRRNPEHLLHSAFRQMKSECSTVKRKMVFGSFLSGTPMSHYVNPKNELEKTFFYPCYIHPEVHRVVQQVFNEKKNSKKWYEDYQWVTREELKEYTFENELYLKTAYDMLYDGYY